MHRYTVEEYAEPTAEATEPVQEDEPQRQATRREGAYRS
jgi:hypothetical protein